MELRDKLKKLVNAYGVSGNEYDVSAIAAELLRPYVDEVDVDGFGNVTGIRRCGIPGAKKVMLDAHLDQIGFLVTEITDEGFLRFMGMGVDQRMLLGSELTVLTHTGKRLPGVVAAMPPHLQNPGDNKKSVPIDKMVVDIGMTGEQAKKEVRIGDYMAFAGDAMDLLGDVVCGKSMDDRACFVCILHALELLRDKPLAVDLIITGTTKEEIGGHGAQTRAWHERPDLAIAIDVCHAKTPDAGPGDRVHEFGGGAVVTVGINSNPHFARRMMEVARAKQIPYQVDAAPSHTGTNAWPIQVVAEGITTLVVSLPLKYMHSPVEMLCMRDVEHVGALLAAFVEDLKEGQL
ncbi:MAG TPA: M42 family peptidase [Candidatus Ventrousia excrementavium]|uniref:M42 family peptidase n=1 Tax=Candidatus Ventrousia excrementavium TaxID=2840961 RepID=A0A9D1LM14_9CLOT|nr:M42 family peptidase [Candidatus Ventrousia excrementavium]